MTFGKSRKLVPLVDSCWSYCSQIMFHKLPYEKWISQGLLAPSEEQNCSSGASPAVSVKSRKRNLRIWF